MSCHKKQRQSAIMYIITQKKYTMKQKMKTKTIILITISLLQTSKILAQTDSISYEIPSIDIIENSLEEALDGDDISAEDLLEELEEMGTSKPNLNNLNYETALRTLKLSDYQYYQLQLYLENYGEMASIYELDGIDGFGREERERLEYLVIVAHAPERQAFFKDFFKRGKSKMLIRYGQILERQAGYDTSRATHYAGTPGHAMFRYTFDTQDKFSFKISGEKDPGEQFFKGEQRYGFDFYSASVSIQDVGTVKKAVLGDYRLNFGQGLAIGSSMLSGKGGGAGSARRFSTGIRAVAPTSESDFLRGTAVTLGNNRAEGTLFAGRTFGSTDNCLGANVSYTHALFKVGARILGYSRSDTCGTSAEKWRRLWQPTGFNVAADYHAILFKQLLFGEIGVNQSGAIGVLQALITNPTPTLKIAVIFRHYDKHYTNPSGHAFGSNSKNAGETGIYLTGDYVLSRRITLNLYADYYRLTTLTYRTDAPIQGLDMGISGEINLTRSSVLNVKYSFRSKPENCPKSVYYKQIQEHHKHKIRLIWSNSPLAALKLKTEFDWMMNRYPMNQNRRSGILLYQDIILNFPKPNISIHARVAYFDTDSYDERLYAYENDVYYAFSIGSYYYKGIRGYLLLRYKYKWISLWLRVTQTYYIDRQVISSGLTQIDKPHKTEIKAQIMFSW